MRAVEMYSVVLANDALSSLLRALLPTPCVRVKTSAELAAETTRRGAVAFVDGPLLHTLDRAAITAPVIAIIDDAPAETLPRLVRDLATYPWLAHFVTTSLLASPHARRHLATLFEGLAGQRRDLIGSKGVGRVALLAQASRREARFDRMRGFFAGQGLSPRAIETMQDVYEELVTNALYDAPTEAGYFPAAVPRTEDVDLPHERACEISYGIEEGTAFVRVRDTFGALTRARLLDVLTRCSANTVSLDESRGGAGLGIWRVFCAATTITITVTPGRLTDILVCFETKNGRIVAKHLHAVHLFFAPINLSSGVYVPDEDPDLIDNSVTLVLVA